MYLPVAFQTLFLALLAALGWGVNLLLLLRMGIQVRPILQLAELPTTNSNTQWIDDGVYDIFRLTKALGAVALLGWLLSAQLSDQQMQTAVNLATYIFIILLLIMPQRVLCHTVRMQFIGLLGRIIKPSLEDPVWLADIVMADILTSCARMFADLVLIACQFGRFIWPIRHETLEAHSGLQGLIQFVREHQAQNACASTGILGVLLVCAPYAFRLRQCINEYLKAVPGSGDARRHLANAIKYASSFPVIALSATQRQVTVDGVMETKYSDWALRMAFTLWIAAVVFNSLYSFYWDVAFDWNLGHTASGWKLSDLITGPSEEKPSNPLVLSPADAIGQDTHVIAAQRKFPYMLRPQLRFGSPRIYYAAIALDFLLRIAWTMKLSSYVRIDMMAYGGFWLNVLEIYRRWQWTFLRLEKETVS
ncbi:protein-ER retention protein [Coemansia brasiliensis]|uniref:Protein-ER retention protein n=1 Tax=Coemansia brasiliensis TaxID=2650707 RepID=A0A9W8I6P0_9FUNG|nr:protein-ER retention protein [Coemansia brasiliensis]